MSAALQPLAASSAVGTLVVGVLLLACVSGAYLLVEAAAAVRKRWSA